MVKTYNNDNALSKLSLTDQSLFHAFSYGLRIDPPYSLVHSAFESIADCQPLSPAVEHDGVIMSYREVEEAANILAHRLIAKGLKPKQRVCLVVQRSTFMVIAILAILKCGCQYVPIDGGVIPEHSLRHIFHDTEALFILCLEKFLNKVQQLTSPESCIIVLDSAKTTALESSAVMNRPNVSVGSHDGAYIIYTSGTTGTPKGVDVSHQNVTNLVCLQPGNLGIEKETLVAQLLSISFDMGQWEILGTLLNGGTLLLRTSDWSAVLKRAKTIIATPSILGTLKSADHPNIKVVALAGEPCPLPLAEEWAHERAFYNCCGPTEVTIVNTMHKHELGLALSIGRPVPNTNVYILDLDEIPVSIGKVGLMWASGNCVSRGYINLPELTAGKYKLDKFRNDGSFMFNTGDLGRWREDGTLEPLGRLDDQVKIKGFRVELNSVAASVEEMPGILKVQAIFDNNILWAFYSGPLAIEESLIKAFVGARQPYYAVPSRWVHQLTLPLTPNGKVDKKALMASVSLNSSQVDIKRPEMVALKDSNGNVVLAQDNTTSSIKPRGNDVSEKQLPPKNGRHGLRAMRHRFFSLYRRFFSIVFLCNMVAMAIVVKFCGYGAELQSIATAMAANLTFAVLMRQELVINALFKIGCSVPTSAPIFIRRNCAKVYHIGGLHSGCAVAATIWLILFTVASTLMHAPPAVLVVTYMTVALLLAMVSSAHPNFRARFHNRFELIHRFAGWTALALFWIQNILLTDYLRKSDPLGHALVRSPGFWLLSVTTLSIILPWLNLRRVTVRPDVLSDHAVRLYFDYCTPVVGTAVRLSNHPLVEWHAFATIAKPDEKGFSLLVSNAGDWTSQQIKRAPSRIWVRGVPACGVLRIAPLFKNIVLVATGSGIGPCLPVIYAKKVPARIFWSTPHPEKTFGSEIIQAIKAADENAVIHNTKTMGRPDMVAITYRLLKESGAEAVCVISNKKLTQMIVYAMESRGIPAFGAIFDS